jgi:hypothetical protein
VKAVRVTEKGGKAGLMSIDRSPEFEYEKANDGADRRQSQGKQIICFYELLIASGGWGDTLLSNSAR